MFFNSVSGQSQTVYMKYPEMRLIQNRSSKIKIFIFGILPRDECYSVNKMLIKEINTILKCECALHSFNLIEQEQGWTDNNNTLDPSLFYHDKAASNTKSKYQAIRVN